MMLGNLVLPLIKPKATCRGGQMSYATCTAQLTPAADNSQSKSITNETYQKTPRSAKNRSFAEFRKSATTADTFDAL
jgi:hypothetical protein